RLVRRPLGRKGSQYAADGWVLVLLRRRRQLRNGGVGRVEPGERGALRLRPALYLAQPLRGGWAFEERRLLQTVRQPVSINAVFPATRSPGTPAQRLGGPSLSVGDT